LTYVITVQNTSDTELDDVKVFDKVPSLLTITKTPTGATRNGQEVMWENVHLNEGETKEFKINVKVKDTAGNNALLVNDATAKSNDHDISDTATDTTKVERIPQIAGAKNIVSVPVTAKTGAGALGLISTLLGGGSLVALAKKNW
jgi:uncharacterized repeat protein (TIGR01451 family)